MRELGKKGVIAWEEREKVWGERGSKRVGRVGEY